ncbi:MAG: DNA repair protein RadC [Pseudomonadota bacterium]
MTATSKTNRNTRSDNRRVYHFRTKDDVISAAIQYIEESARTNEECFTSSTRAAQLLRLRIGAQEREVFSAVYLTTQHQMIAVENLFYGTIDGAAIYPREVVKAALQNNASALILAHNHPSGVLTPSEADRRITDRLQRALATVDIRVLDHLIVSSTGSYSFAEHGLI